MGKMYLVVTCAFFTALQVCYAPTIYKEMGPTVISTRYGKLRGILVQFKNSHLRPVESYLGLQYASLRQGRLRFMPPTSPLEKWKGIRTAVNQRGVCPQAPINSSELNKTLPLGRVRYLEGIASIIEKQDEECLTLNVYIPLRGKLYFISWSLYV